MYDLGDDGEYDAYSEYQRESTMDSRYSESLNALIGHPNASWSPNTIKNCECCNKEFKFTRRRHHCRKCGCLVCYKCSKRQLVLPRVSDSPLRVCDSCYDQVNCNPVEDLTINSAEDSIAKEFLSNIVYISLISKTDILLQAIIQGFSTSLSGSPLGMEVDVRKFSPRSWNVRFASCPSTPIMNQRKRRTTSTTPKRIQFLTPDEIDGDDDDHSNKNYKKDKKQEEDKDGDNQKEPSPLLTEQEIRTTENQAAAAKNGTESRNNYKSDSDSESLSSNEATQSTSPSFCSTQAPTQLLDLAHYTEFARLRGCRNAQESYELFTSEHQVSPDYGIAIEMGFCTLNGSDSGKVKALQNKRKRQKQQWQQRQQQRQQQQENVRTYSVVWQHNYSFKENKDEKVEDNIFVVDADEHLSERTEVETYYLFYWIAIWDGTQLRCGRSSQVLLPPSVCSLLESPTFFDKLVRTEVTSTTKLPTECNDGETPYNGPDQDQQRDQLPVKQRQMHTQYTHTYREVDPESILISLLSQQEQDYLLSSCSLRSSIMTHTLRSTLHNLPSPPASQAQNLPSQSGSNLPDTTLLTPTAGLIGWLSGGKVNRNKFLESAIHMTMLPFLFMRSVYEPTQQMTC